MPSATSTQTTYSYGTAKGWRIFSLAAWIGPAVVALLYGVAAATTINCALDSAMPQMHSVPVLDQHLSSGKTTTYYLNVAP